MSPKISFWIIVLGLSAGIGILYVWFSAREKPTLFIRYLQMLFPASPNRISPIQSAATILGFTALLSVALFGEGIPSQLCVMYLFVYCIVSIIHRN